MRECGECTACCVALEIKVLEKPAYLPCQHVAKDGCSIYTNRPMPCRAFSCAWLQGFLDDDQRPDKSGAIVWQTQTDGSIQTIISVLAGMEPDQDMVGWVRKNAKTVIVEREGFEREVQ